MKYIADLHIHSHYSIATSKQLVPEHLDLWGRIKGITVIGTGDFTHPGWTTELKDKLEPAEEGLFQLKPQRRLDEGPILEDTSNGHLRFCLSAEISTIYKKGDKTRKVHHLILAPDFETVEKIQYRLDKIGNITSDGRPILGLDSRNLLEIALEANSEIVFIPAHIWTPWFSALGDKSGFDSIDECYGDLAGHIHAIETGLSSDPPMNWRCSFLDRFNIISNSDAHSPQKLGREANLLDTELSYPALTKALQSGDQETFLGTIEFFPEEGKYHHDGHRKCNISWEPDETDKHNCLCPVCGKRVTVGVLNRVNQLADRQDGTERDNCRPFHSLIPLKEILGEILGVSPNTKKVAASYDRLITQIGSEFRVLLQQPIERIREVGGDSLALGIERMRSGKVYINAGYDGEFGVIKVFTAEERKTLGGQGLLFVDSPSTTTASTAPTSTKASKKGPKKKGITLGQAPPHIALTSNPKNPLAALNDEQFAAAQHTTGPALIMAGPGTGKTRVLTCRIKYLVKTQQVAPDNILAVTFTNKAAQEMKERLLKIHKQTLSHVYTFHALGYMVLSEQLGDSLTIIDQQDKQTILTKLGCRKRECKQISDRITTAKQQLVLPQHMDEEDLAPIYWDYQNFLSEHDLVDLDDLICRSTRLLMENPDIARIYRDRFQWVMVDEYQDVNYAQYQLIRTLCPDDQANLYVIGDPNQAIYGFRGADVRYIEQFLEDWPNAKQFTLNTSYRCTNRILRASGQVIQAFSEGQGLQGLHSGVRLQMVEQRSDKAEAEFVARTIENLIGGLRFFSMDSDISDGHQYKGIRSLDDFAVLCRTTAQMAALEKAFFDHSVPYQRIDQESFFKKSPIAAILDLIKWSLLPGHVLLSERVKQNKLTVLPEAPLDLIPEMEPAEAIHIVWQTCFDAKTKKQHDATYQELLAFCRNNDRALSDFIHFADLATSVDTYRHHTEKVALMTLHSSKGLEFPCVFIVGCEDRLLPYGLFEGQTSDPTEERRLLYVGMTRAKHLLYLTWAKTRMLNGRTYQLPPSPFLHTIEKELTEIPDANPPKRKKKQDNQMMLFT
jgi:DNA helicase II / ATP-dependent DNA helicase PcrA